MAQGSTKGVPIDTDGTLSANSDTVVPSQKAVRTLVAANPGPTGPTGPQGAAGSTGATGASLSAAYFVSASYYGPPNIVSGGTRAISSGGASATPFLIAKNITIDQLQVDLSAASAGSLVFDLHLFATDANGYLTGAPVATATVTTTGTGTQVLNASTGSVAISAGLYFGVVHNRSAGSVTPRATAAACHMEPLPHASVTTANQYACWTYGSAGTSAITSWPAVGSVTPANQAPIVQFRVA